MNPKILGHPFSFHRLLLVVPLLFTISLFLTAVPFTGAATPGSIIGGSAGAAAVKGETGLPTDNWQLLVGQTISVILGILGIVLIVTLVYAGFLYLTAQEGEEKTKKAKHMMINAAIGMVIVLCAYALTVYIVGRLNNIASDAEFEQALDENLETQQQQGGNPGDCGDDEACWQQFYYQPPTPNPDDFVEDYNNN